MHISINIFPTVLQYYKYGQDFENFSLAYMQAECIDK